MMTMLDRFWVKVQPEPNTGCWLWTGAVNACGYGTFNMDRKKVRAHRVAYELTNGPIPNEKQIDHLCRVRSCVNPDHLEAVSKQENIARGNAGKNNRIKTHCPHGHPYNEVNTYRANGRRFCRTCKTARRAFRRVREWTTQKSLSP